MYKTCRIFRSKLIKLYLKLNYHKIILKKLYLKHYLCRMKIAMLLIVVGLLFGYIGYVSSLSGGCVDCNDIIVSCPGVEEICDMWPQFPELNDCVCNNDTGLLANPTYVTSMN